MGVSDGQVLKESLDSSGTVVSARRGLWRRSSDDCHRRVAGRLIDGKTPSIVGRDHPGMSGEGLLIRHLSCGERLIEDSMSLEVEPVPLEQETYVG